MKKILFFKEGSFSHTNNNVYKILKENFKNFPIQTVDVWSDLVNKKSPYNLLNAIREYWRDLILGRKDIRDCVEYTPYIFRCIRRMIHKKFNTNEILFTFQTQSIFDASINGVPNFVYTDHTHLYNLYYPGYSQNNLYSKQWIKCEREIYQNAAVNFTMSQNISQSLIDQYHIHPNKIRCVYVGVNVPVKTFIEKTRKDSNHILMVGVDWMRKGGPTLIRAFQEVKKVIHDAKLTVVGCKPNINIEDCFFTGKIPLERVSEFYQTANLFCLPTEREPFGISFLEAMSYRLPVIGTNIGAIPEFIHHGKNGYLIQPKDYKTLAQYIIDILKSKEKQYHFGNYGYQLINKKYSWQNTGKLISNTISQILSL